MKLRVLASGSKGNCIAVRSAGGALLLVDLGLSCRETRRRAEACGFDPGEAAGVLFTHDHSDHYSGLATFHKCFPDIPLFANGDTADAIACATGVADGWRTFETASAFPLADFSVTAFSTSHDAADPVGYLLADATSALFVGTDTGIATIGVRNAFARATAAILESNHDPILLTQSNRAESLKQRIRSRSGHLANEDAANLVRETPAPNLRTLLLAHLSDECNSPSLARKAMEDALAEIHRADVALGVLDQHVPSALYEF